MGSKCSIMELTGGLKKYNVIFKHPRSLTSLLTTNEKQALKNFNQLQFEQLGVRRLPAPRCTEEVFYYYF